MRCLLALFVLAGAAGAEVRPLGLREAVAIAVKQNPDVVLARLEELRAQQDIRVARDPFMPRAVLGSGLAYSYGFPMSVEGSAPSVLQARVIGSVFNRPQTYRVLQAKENAKGAAIDVEARRDEVAVRTAALYLDAARAGRFADVVRRQMDGLESVTAAVRARVQEGRALELDLKRAELNRARTAQRVESLQVEREFAEESLAAALGYPSGDRVHPTDEGLIALDLPPTEEESVRAAVESNKQIRRIESAMAAKGLEIHASRATRLPQVDLVAQYGLFAKFNNYEDYFRRFSRHNAQLGVSFQLPLTPSPGSRAQATQAELDVQHLKTELNQTRDRISLDTRRAYHNARLAERSREVSKLALDLSREQVTVLLAQLEEGRVSFEQVEAARADEQEKWIALYDAQYTAEKARLEVLKQTGRLVAALK